jgi:hypothetical protein
LAKGWEATANSGRQLSIENRHFLAVLHELDMGAEFGFQLADLCGSHIAVPAYMTNMAILWQQE